MKKQETPEEDLLKLAATCNFDKIGRHREEDGTLPGWHEWSRRHPQRDDRVAVCRGREEWQQYRQQQAAHQLSLVSWNILSDAWWTKEKSQGGYDHTPFEQGEWSFRLQLLLQWIEKLNPSLLALQEVDYRKFEEDLLPELTKRGYDGRKQKAKKGDKNPCGVATFWKAETFQLVQEKSFSRTQCVVLNDQKSNYEVCLTNVHLESAQSQEGSEKRARQLNSALVFAAKDAPNAGLLVCGDCNTGADSELFRVIREYQWHGHALSSVYEHPDTHKTLHVSQATFLYPGHYFVIDQMLYEPEAFRLKAVLDALSSDEAQEHVYEKGNDCGFPSAFCPSDHIPIGAVFEMRPRQPATQQPQEEPTLSEERKTLLTAQWEELQSKRPPHTKGKPTPEQIEERKSFAKATKAWKDTVKENPAELDFVTQLIRSKK